MRNLPKEKIKTITIILLSITLIITVPMLNHEKQEDEEQFESFLNEFYHHLDLTLMAADNILESPEDIEDWDYHLKKLRHHLDQTSLVLETGNRFIDWDIQIESYFFKYVSNFSADDEPTEEQLAELENIRDALQYMKDGLYSEETGQENKDLSIDQFNEIISEGAKLGE
ncbi:DUF1741 domain-containing protein [Filobacillus milosensis]|uniref:DUF1741 domain-containing protein n=1 Tax=Filobacillus milosensis TaxID=94137 RepID=A0A4Y8IIZ0_9BACI|nr:DUF1741 domain-containing protein [Filobacillus milosensis]TFB19546.1 DUF1741 domain-containing protein [Filobacillus milosensis]